MNKTVAVLCAAAILAAAVIGGCPIHPPLGQRGARHQYEDLNEIFRHIDHYYARLKEQRETFDTSVSSFNDMMRYCDYIEALCRQAEARWGTESRPLLGRRSVEVIQVVRSIRELARSLQRDKEQVPVLIDQLGPRIDALKQAA